jgi:hypothetical protein
MLAIQNSETWTKSPLIGLFLMRFTDFDSEVGERFHRGCEGQCGS